MMLFEEFLRTYDLDSSKDYTTDTNMRKLIENLLYAFVKGRDRKLEIGYDDNGDSWELYIQNIGYGRGATLPEALISLYTTIPLVDTFNNNSRDINDAHALKLLTSFDTFD